MSKDFHEEFHEIFNDGVIPGPYEPIFWLNDDRFKFKVDPRIKSVEFVPDEKEPDKGRVCIRVDGLSGVESTKE